MDTATAPTAVSTSVPFPVWASLLGQPAVSGDELLALQRLASTRRLAAGAQAFVRGQVALNLVAVVSGVVGLGTRGDDQLFHLERAVHGPQWLDISSAWICGGYAQQAQALSAAVLLELPVAGVRQMVKQHPLLADRLLQALAQTVQNLTGATHDLMSKDAQKRLATWLLQRSTDVGLDVALKERKRELAAQLAITPETLSRLLRQLMSAGLIEVRGYSIKLLNLPALQNLAQG